MFVEISKVISPSEFLSPPLPARATYTADIILFHLNILLCDPSMGVGGWGGVCPCLSFWIIPDLTPPPSSRFLDCSRTRYFQNRRGWRLLHSERSGWQGKSGSVQRVASVSFEATCMEKRCVRLDDKSVQNWNNRKGENSALAYSEKAVH
jgi:hypothetical protein